MLKSPKINVYINASKSYYYPGEKFQATILLDIQDKLNCNKMKIIARGKQIIKATQTNKFANEEQPVEYESSSSGSDDDEDENPKLKRRDIEDGPTVTINETKKIFDFRKEIVVSQTKVLVQGKYSYPFEVEIPEDIPGTFLYLDKKIYAEIAYCVKVKLDTVNIKKIAPIVIRQKEEVFNYTQDNKYERKIHGCCCIVGQTSIKLTALEDYTKTGDPVKLMVNINNDTNTTSTPITVEVYKKLLLKGANNKKIKVTKIVGYYQGKRIINSREKFQKKLHVAIEGENYLKEHIDETKAAKSFKHKEIIPFLFQSIKSDNITCEFEVYAESQYANITNDDLGVFLSVLIYPIEDGVLSKSVMNIAKAFVSGIINKKFFLQGENLLKKEKEEEKKRLEKKPEKKPRKKRKLYEESEISEETIKFENKLTSKKLKKKKKDDSNSDSDEEIQDFQNLKSDELNSINMINNNKNKIKNEEKESSNKHDDTDSNIDNIPINNNNNNINIQNSGNNQIRDSNKINSEEVSFGTSSKEKNYFVSNISNDQSSNIKKSFNKNFLNDPIDDQGSDGE